MNSEKKKNKIMGGCDRIANAKSIMLFNRNLYAIKYIKKRILYNII